jgi:hypothetical protein
MISAAGSGISSRSTYQKVVPLIISDDKIRNAIPDLPTDDEENEYNLPPLILHNILKRYAAIEAIEIQIAAKERARLGVRDAPDVLEPKLMMMMMMGTAAPETEQNLVINETMAKLETNDVVYSHSEDEMKSPTVPTIPRMSTPPLPPEDLRSNFVDSDEDWDADPLAAIKDGPDRHILGLKPPLVARIDDFDSARGSAIVQNRAPDEEWSSFGQGVVAIGGSTDDGRLAALSCGSCGFAVLRFRGAAWSADADYMHFRNYNGHSLDLPKLTAKLVDRPGWAAYACQCAWDSASTRCDLCQWGAPPSILGGAANGLLRWNRRKL